MAVQSLIPEISRFFGIVIAMFYGGHPPPHFHVRCGDQRALMEIQSLALLKGYLAPRALGQVTEWPRTATNYGRIGRGRRNASRSKR